MSKASLWLAYSSNHFKGLNTYVLESHTTKYIKFQLIQRKLYFEQHYLLMLMHNFTIALSKSWISYLRNRVLLVQEKKNLHSFLFFFISFLTFRITYTEIAKKKFCLTLGQLFGGLPFKIEEIWFEL